MDSSKTTRIMGNYPTYPGISTVTKVAAIVGQSMVGRLVPWRQGITYHERDIIYFIDTVEHPIQEHCTTIRLAIPRQVGTLTKADLKNPAKCTILNTLEELLERGGKIRDEDKQAILREVDAKFTQKKYVVVSKTKPSNPECQLWIKPITTRTVFVANSFL